MKSASVQTPDRLITDNRSPEVKRKLDEAQAWLSDLWDPPNGGDAGAAGDWKVIFDKLPFMVETIAGLQKMAEERLFDVIASRASGHLAIREHLRRQVAAVRDETAGSAPTPLEQMLANRVAIDWLNAAIADLQHAEALAAGYTAEADRLQKRSERAERQMLRAIKTLATIRRLQIPAVQVNIAEKQVNITT